MRPNTVRLESTALRSALQAAEIPALGRLMRHPRHHFNLRMRPFALCPMGLVPVLPGDTMKRALFQFSALTDPVKNPLIGWWYQCWLFYVPFRSMDNIWSYIQTMALDPAFGELNAAADVTNDVAWYHAHNSRPSFVQHAVKAVVEEFFREDGETWTSGVVGSYPQIGLKDTRALGSMVLDSATTEPDTLPGQFDEDGTLDDELGTGAVDFAGAYDAWQVMVANKLADVTYEDFLRSYGVKIPAVAEGAPVPELLRYGKWWKKPFRAIDETDGSIAAAVGWEVNLSADKDRRFKEPGFLLPLCCAHPKVYFANQGSHMTDFLTRSLDWMPKMLQAEPYTNIKLFSDTGGDGPLGTVATGDYQLDLRDLFAKGDQFVNFALSETDAHLVSLPTSGLSTRYPTSGDIDALFAAASPANQVRTEGVLEVSIAGSLQDMTP